MKGIRISGASLALLVSLSGISAAQSEPRFYSPQDRSTGDDIPSVRVWLDDKTFLNGDIIRPRVAADEEAYVTVFRVTTDGELKVLYPHQPDRQQPFSLERFANDPIPVRGASAFSVSEGAGNGFVFAVASYYKFNYSYYTYRHNWSLARLASTSRVGNPFEIVRRFVDEITEGSESYSMDYVMYDVSFNQYRSRYATRYRQYAYNDYYNVCVDAFGYYYRDYCRGYYGGAYYPGVVIFRPGNGNSGAPASGKTMRMRPLVVDPLVDREQQRAASIQGTLQETDARERAAMARREQMLRDAKPRVNPMIPERRQAEPEPRIIRPAPRADFPPPQPRVDTPRQVPQPSQRVEVRNDPTRPAPAPAPSVKPAEKQKDN
jgi:hypothetical protein